jgi:hypothetical protein
VTSFLIRGSCILLPGGQFSRGCRYNIELLESWGLRISKEAKSSVIHNEQASMNLSSIGAFGMFPIISFRVLRNSAGEFPKTNMAMAGI